MVLAGVQGLGVVVPPGGEHVVALALARPAIGLDLHSANGLKITHLVKQYTSSIFVLFSDDGFRIFCQCCLSKVTIHSVHITRIFVSSDRS